MLTLSDVKIGQPTKPTEWNNKLQKNIEVNYKDLFISTIRRSNHKRLDNEYWDAHSQRLATIKTSSDTLIPDAAHYHTNYLDYLEKCWADHLGIVITPDIIWYTILCEFATIVKNDSQNYRSLFTNSPEKKEIIVPSGDLSVMPLDVLTKALRDEVPSDTSIFFPGFQSFTPNSPHAFLAAFCDICSPYYNYSMYLCGFPLIDIRGVIDDWKILRDQWVQLKKVVQQNDVWVGAVDKTLNLIVDNFGNTEFWKEIFKVKNCGSGHQTLITGWFTDLFREQPKVRYVENFSSHISNIKYKQLDTKKNYEMSVGLFNSTIVENCMEPIFSFIVYDVTDLQGA
jgi:hypothetical protein